MTHLWERRHKKENTESCPRWILPSLPTRFSLRRWHFRLPQLIFFPLRFTIVWKTVPLRHFAFSSQQHQGFISFLFFFLRHRQKKLNASKTGVAEGQIETNKRCLEYCVKLNFQFLHHFCLVSIIFPAAKKKKKKNCTVFSLFTLLIFSPAFSSSTRTGACGISGRDKWAEWTLFCANRKLKLKGGGGENALQSTQSICCTASPLPHNDLPWTVSAGRSFGKQSDPLHRLN